MCSQGIASLNLDEELLAEVLAEHADNLNWSEDGDDELLARYPQARSLLASLFSLARRIRDVLVPLVPSERFVVDLRRRLEKKQLSRARWLRYRSRMLQIAGILGLIVSVFALLALIVRGIVSLVVLIVHALSRRRAATPA